MLPAHVFWQEVLAVRRVARFAQLEQANLDLHDVWHLRVLLGAVLAGDGAVGVPVLLQLVRHGKEAAVGLDVAEDAAHTPIRFLVDDPTDLLQVLRHPLFLFRLDVDLLHHAPPRRSSIECERPARHVRRFGLNDLGQRHQPLHGLLVRPAVRRARLDVVDHDVLPLLLRHAVEELVRRAVAEVHDHERSRHGLDDEVGLAGAFESVERDGERDGDVLIEVGLDVQRAELGAEFFTSCHQKSPSSVSTVRSAA